MKILKTCASCVLFTLLYLHSDAQNASVPLNEPDYNKPKLFTDLPQKMTLRITEMENLFNLAVGSTVNTRATDQLQLTGMIVSKSDVQDNSLKSVVVRTSRGAIFTFTRTTNSDGSYNYIGRMMSMQHGDAYEVVRENGQYVLSKTGLYDLFAE